MKKQKIIFILIGLLAFAGASLAEPIPEDILKSIAYITTPTRSTSQDNIIVNDPIGTGFMIGVSYPWDNTRKYMFLVTAKHVLFDDEGRRINKLLLRMNDRLTNKSTDYDILRNDLWFFHPDNAVDLAIQPIVPVQANFLVIPSDAFVTEHVIKQHNIGLGDDVFYTGMLPYHSGTDRIIPIARFGRIALVTEEKTGDGKYYYFIDAGNMPGHSGSPVFLWATPSRSTSQLVAGGRIFGLYGVVSGLLESYKQIKFVTPRKTNVSPIPIYSIPGGVTAIVPVRYLNELLNNQDVITKIRALSINKYRDGS